MNGVKGMLVKCRYCGREVFLRAIAGKYTTGENGERYENVTAYDPLPDGWHESLLGDPICPECCATKIHGRVAGEKTIWARLGVTLHVTETQYEDIFGNDEKAADKAFKTVIDAGMYTPDGESYIPTDDGKDIEFML
jgi:hypothetical protein